MHEKLRDRALESVGRVVTAHPRTTLGIAGVLAAGCILLAVFGLKIRTERSELVNIRLDWNQRYAQFKEQFPRWNDVVVMIVGDASDSSVDAFARDLSRRLASMPGVAHADAGFQIDEAGPRLFISSDRPTFDKTLQDLAEARDLAAISNPNGALAKLVGQLSRDSGDVSQLDRLEEFLGPFLESITGAAPDFGFLSPARTDWQSFRTGTMPDGKAFRFVNVHLKSDQESLEGLAAGIQALRSAIAAYLSDHPPATPIEWGVTGIPAIEADETAQSVRDSTLASILAAVLITGLMVGVFRGIRVPLMAMASLFVGLSLSFGWIVISVGHLQVLSVTFCSILMGLGIDYALLFISRLELVRPDQPNLSDAVVNVLRRVGPGMITGAVTTAAAFASTALTDFTGMAEMGLIAGGGIILCVVAVIFTLPALLGIGRTWEVAVRSRRGGEEAHFGHGRLDLFDRRPKATLAVGLVVVAVLGWMGTRIEYDPNVLNLQAPGVESVAWEERFAHAEAKTMWAALSRTSPEGSREKVRSFRLLKSVAEVGGMGILYPADLDDRLAKIMEIDSREPGVPSASTGLQATVSQLNAIRGGISVRRLAGGIPPEIDSRLRSLSDRIGLAISEAADLDAEASAAAWETLARSWEQARTRLQSFTDRALDGSPPDQDDLPEALRERFIGLDGSWLLMVYPRVTREGASILDADQLEPFVQSLRTADTEVFGPPVQILESTRIIIRSYIIAAGLAIGAILILLLLDFRNLLDAVCCLVPVFIGFVGAFGLMGLASVPLNFANLIVLPLIFGLGMDASVNMVHRWKQEPLGRPAGLSGGTGRGITLALVTTMIGFGSLLISDHRGIRSLGFAVVVGLGVTLMACYSVLPALLRWRTHDGGLGERDTIIPES